LATSNPPKPAVLYAPIVGFLNLMGERAEPLLEADRQALAPLFRNSVASTAAYPRCDVLFLYGEVDGDGRLVGAKDSLPDVVKGCSARLAVLAIVSNADALKKIPLTKNEWAASIVLTLDRKGDKFARFFRKLFEAMFDGATLGIAWVRLAPQVRGMPSQNENPDTVMIGGLLQLTFGKER
jgi:hypothetical protein